MPSKRRCYPKTNKKTPVLESLFDKKKTPTYIYFCEFYELFKNSPLYRAPPVVASGLSLSTFSNSNPNCGRSLFINYINTIGVWGTKPNNKIIKSITSSLSIVLELSKKKKKKFQRVIYGRKNALINAYLNVKSKFQFLSNFFVC